MFNIAGWLPLFVLPWVIMLMTKSTPSIGQEEAPSVKLLGKFPFRNAAFTSIYPRGEGKNRTYDLLLSSFEFWSTKVAIVRNLEKYLKDVPAIEPEELTSRMKWPNEVQEVPPQVFQTGRRMVVIPDGFLIPSKGDGSITLLDLEPSHPNRGGQLNIFNRDEAREYPRHVISQGKGEWFYHRVIWRDMDKDGKLDALTGRAHMSFTGVTRSDLVWFRQPEDGKITRPWDLNVIESGPDVYVAMVNMTNEVIGTREVIITAEFFHPRFRLFWTEDPKQNWANSKLIRSRDVDNVTSGSPFDVIFDDINNDDQPEIVLTVNSPTNGSVVAYEIPKDFRTGHFTRHILTSGYKSVKSGRGTGAPGSPLLLRSKDAKSKPSILVSGDDSAKISLLTPSAPTDPADWSYTRNDFFKTENSTIGGLSIGDVDSDGNMELFTPSYDEGYVYVHRFSEV